MKVQTVLLQSMVSKAVKGCSNNKMLPMTSVMAVSCADGKLTLITTDMTNYLYVSEDANTDEDFYVTVRADMFTKLIMSITSETVTFEMTDKYLEVKGNGVYKIDVILDENGGMIKFPDFEPSDTAVGNVPTTVVHTMLSALKPALSKDVVTPCYTNYFVGDTVIATNMEVINMLNTKLLNTEEPLFISSELMDLVGLCTDEVIDVRYEDGVIDFITNSVKIHGTLFEYAEQYQTDDINEVAKNEYPSQCSVNKNVLLQTLDRIALFTDDEFSDNAVNIKFTADGLTIESPMSNGVETIEYVTSDHDEDFSGTIDAVALKDQIRPYSAEHVEILYGREDSIKLVQDEQNFVSIIGLIVE